MGAMGEVCKKISLMGTYKRVAYDVQHTLNGVSGLGGQGLCLLGSRCSISSQSLADWSGILSITREYYSNASKRAQLTGPRAELSWLTFCPAIPATFERTP